MYRKVLSGVCLALFLLINLVFAACGAEPIASLASTPLPTLAAAPATFPTVTPAPIPTVTSVPLPVAKQVTLIGTLKNKAPSVDNPQVEMTYWPRSEITPKIINLFFDTFALKDFADSGGSIATWIAVTGEHTVAPDGQEALQVSSTISLSPNGTESDTLGVFEISLTQPQTGSSRPSDLSYALKLPSGQSLKLLLDESVLKKVGDIRQLNGKPILITGEALYGITNKDRFVTKIRALLPEQPVNVIGTLQEFHGYGVFPGGRYVASFFYSLVGNNGKSYILVTKDSSSLGAIPSGRTLTVSGDHYITEEDKADVIFAKSIQ